MKIYVVRHGEVQSNINKIISGCNDEKLTEKEITIYNGEIKEIKFKGLEGEWINFEWVDISIIHQYKIFPEGIQSIIDGSSTSNHLITDLIKKI